MIYFSDIFNVNEDELEDYGAFNISLVNDLPLFVDPFLLYASDKEDYKRLHEGIIQYLSFLKEKASEGELTDGKISRWYRFPEVKQVWFGYSQTGNSGAGLGKDFAMAMSNAIIGVFKDLNNEKITKSSHLEKLGLFKGGVGRDNISDFTCNLIKGYLLDYTQSFAISRIDQTMLQRVMVDKAYFNYEKETWMSKEYILPFYNGDYVLLTPKDILTKDETWISFPDLKKDILTIVSTVPNVEIRDRLNDLYLKSLPSNPKDRDKTYATQKLIEAYPEIVDYYIKAKEENADKAIENSKKVVADTNTVFVDNIKAFAHILRANGFYHISEQRTLEAARQRLLFLKDMIENKDVYKLFYHDNKQIGSEKTLQLIFKLTWYQTDLDVNSEVNNGRGPVDYKVSRGKHDSTLVEFKLAKNSKLRQNLVNQLNVYLDANNTKHGLTAIMYFTAKEQKRLFDLLKELELENNPNVITINAIDDKLSASNVK